MSFVLKRFLRKWVKALRSGEYKQGCGALLTRGAAYDNFCCLGVAFDLMVLDGVNKSEWDGRWARTGGPGASGCLTTLDIPSPLHKWLTKDIRYDGFGMNIEALLMRANDRGSDFNYIADIIEKRIPK